MAQLQWFVLATQIRCHTIQIMLTSRDTKVLASLVSDLDKMTLPAEANPTTGMGGGAFPVSIKDYAREENVLARVDPLLTERRFNSIPVRSVVGKKGAAKQVHLLSAFPEQAKAITRCPAPMAIQTLLAERKAGGGGDWTHVRKRATADHDTFNQLNGNGMTIPLPGYAGFCVAGFSTPALSMRSLSTEQVRFSS